MGNNVERIIVGNERTEVETCYILNIILGTYARGQFLVSAHPIPQCLNFCQKLRMRFPETLAALLRASIKDSTIGKNNTSRYHHTVAVGMNTTVHT